MTPAEPNQCPAETAEASRWVPLAGPGRAFIRPAWQASFTEAGVRDSSDFFRVEGEALTKAGLGSRYRARLKLERGGVAETVYLKRMGAERIGEQLRRWYEDARCQTAAEREVRVADALLQMGIQAPETLAWGVVSRGFRSRSFVVTRTVLGEAVDRWIDRGVFSPAVEGWGRKKILVHRLAGLARRFHGAGWFHRDFYLCHIFVTETGDDFHLALIDLARVFRPRWRRKRWVVKDLSQLNYSAAARHFTRTMRLRFALEYLGVEKLAPAHKRLLRGILRKTAAIARHDAR